MTVSDVYVAKQHCVCGCWQKQRGRPKGTTWGEPYCTKGVWFGNH